MCVGSHHVDPRAPQNAAPSDEGGEGGAGAEGGASDAGGEGGTAGSSAGGVMPQDYSQIFTELENHLIIHRALLLHRLVRDPFYHVMNVSTVARLWMLRHLMHLAAHADSRYRVNLIQYFELIGREETLKFLRYKNAPREIVELWNAMFPAPPAPRNNNILKRLQRPPPHHRRRA